MNKIKKGKSAALIFPHQLFKEHPAIKDNELIFLIEDKRFFTDFNFHKMKLMHHRTTMQEYKKFLEKKKKTVIYVEFKESDLLFSMLKKNLIQEIHYADTIDHILEKRLADTAKKYKIKKIIHESPGFLTPLDWFKKIFKGKKHFHMTTFYIAQRKRLKILIDQHEKPVGGKWSFDPENRKKLGSSMNIPTIKKPKNSQRNILEAKKWVEANFKNNPGDTQEFFYPISFTQAEQWLDDFLIHRLNHFGDYEDAISNEHQILFHSVLSPLLNNGLLTPDYVIKKTLTYANKKNITINNLEGFIRQIIGWREFVRCMYEVAGEKQRKSNFWKNTTPLPKNLWYGKSGITILDTTIQNVLKTAYAHHIERLMILGNFMLLCSIKPHDVYTWFMELFIDAYDWVMIPNIYGMSQYADGGLMTTKPYFSSSNYILTMSDFKKGKWCETWDALYWHFLLKNKDKLSKNPRLKILTYYANRLKAATLQKHLNSAQQFLEKLKKNDLAAQKD